MSLISILGIAALVIGVLAGIFSLVMWFLKPLDVLEKMIEEDKDE